MIAFDGAFHGRTLMAMSLTSKQHPYKAGMGPFAPEVYRAPFPNPYRWEGDDPAGEALAALRRMLVTHVAAEDVAAIIFEPVQGEGGFVVPPAEWVRGLRELADEHGIVLIADEVQSGYGRTGKLFAIEHFGVEPDLITVAKSMAAGVPMSGVFGRAELMDAAPDSSIGGTYVGLAARLCGRAGRAGRDRAAATSCAAAPRSASASARASTSGRRAFDQIGDVRGLGPMLGARVRHRPGQQDARRPSIATAVHEHAVQSGLLLLKAGIHGNCVRVLVALVATDEQIAEALDIFEGAIEQAVGAPHLATTAG